MSNKLKVSAISFCDRLVAKRGKVPNIFCYSFYRFWKRWSHMFLKYLHISECNGHDRNSNTALQLLITSRYLIHNMRLFHGNLTLKFISLLVLANPNDFILKFILKFVFFLFIFTYFLFAGGRRIVIL